MKRNNLQARIVYSKDEDEYQLFISTNGGETWGFSRGCKCVRSEHDKPTDEPMFIRVSFVEAIRQALNCGYEIVY